MNPYGATVRKTIRLGMESLWLLTVFAVPLAFAPPGWMLSYIQTPKVALLRILVGSMAMLWAIEWWVVPQPRARRSPASWKESFRAWLHQNPARWVLVAASVYLGVYALSTVLSTSVRLSVWGSAPGEDGYGLYTTASYFVLFLVIATHLKTRSQMWRLMGVVVGSGAIASIVAILRGIGVDPVGLPEHAPGRALSTFGNPIFFGAFLVMTIPLSFALMGFAKHALSRYVGIGVCTVLAAAQLVAMAMTYSRGPWLGVLLSFAMLGILGGLMLDRRALAKVALGCGLVVIAAFVLFLLLPRLSGSLDFAGRSGIHSVDERFSSIGSAAFGGDTDPRLSIWRVSLQLIVERPWFSFDTLTLSYLRPLIGYGPELFEYVYPLAAPSATEYVMHQYAHNRMIHQTVELGYLGLSAYVGLLAVFFGSAAILFSSKPESTDGQGWTT